MKPKFRYFGNGYWRGVDSLGRVSQFYTWKMLWKMYDKKRKKFLSEVDGDE